jgi:Domain of Unknown Function (DUF928)
MMGKIWKKMLRVTIILLIVLSLWIPVQSPAAAETLFDIIAKRVRTIISSGAGRTAPTGRSNGGAGRGPLCPAYLNTAIQAILPVQSGSKVASQATVSELVWGTTTEAQPTLWFYVPHQAGELKTAKFVLLDEDQQLVIPSPVLLTLKETPGIVAVHLPVALEVNKSYNWYFSITCNDEKPSRNPSVRGWIERVEPSSKLLASLQSSDSALIYRIYAEYGIWYDMVTYLIKQRQINPTNNTLQADWAGLLELLNAPTLQNVPVVHCCEPITL